MHDASNHHQVVNAVHGPPMNELPVPVVAAVAWRSAGVVLAIPALFVYTSGVEMTILYRTKDKKPSLTSDRAAGELASMRGWYKRLNGLKINGIPIELLGAQFYDLGFNARAWSAFITHEIGQAKDAISFELDWPEFEHRIHTLRGVRQQSRESEILWRNH